MILPDRRRHGATLNEKERDVEANLKIHGLNNKIQAAQTNIL
jgi:hypothetical protein